MIKRIIALLTLFFFIATSNSGWAQSNTSNLSTVADPVSYKLKPVNITGSRKTGQVIPEIKCRPNLGATTEENALFSEQKVSYDVLGTAITPTTSSAVSSTLSSYETAIISTLYIQEGTAGSYTECSVAKTDLKKCFINVGSDPAKVKTLLAELSSYVASNIVATTRN